MAYLNLLLIVLFVVVPVAIGWAIGSSVEAQHFRQLAADEAALQGVMLSDLRRLPAHWRAAEARLVVGEAVIATDYFKTFAARLRKLVGGRVGSLETLVERARRQALVRMQQQAAAYGANVVWNVRMTCMTLEDGERQQSSRGVQIMVFGTALKAWADDPS